MIKRPVWYVIDHILFSPDGKIRLIAESDKLKDIPNMVITDPEMLHVVQGASELKYTEERRSLRATVNGKKVNITTSLASTGNVPRDVISAFVAFRDSVKAFEGTDMTGAYKRLLSVNPVSLGIMGIYATSISFVGNGTIVTGTPSWIDFTPIDDPTFSTNAYPMFVNDLLDVINKGDLVDSEIKQSIQGNTAVVQVTHNGENCKTVYQARFKMPDMTSFDRVMAYGKQDLGEEVVKYDRETYNEIGRAVKKDSKITLHPDKSISVLGSLTERGRKMHISSESAPTKEITIPGDAFSYKLAAADTFSIHEGGSVSGTKTKINIFKAGPVLGVATARN